MDAAEVARVSQIGSDALVQLLQHVVAIAFQLLGAVFRQLRDRGLRRIPVAWAMNCAKITCRKSRLSRSEMRHSFPSSA